MNKRKIFEGVFFMELNEIRNWSYDELDDAIVSKKKTIDFNEKEIARLNTEIKMLREVKSQKTMADSLKMITDLGIDFSLTDLQAFLQSKKNPASTENVQENQTNDATHEGKIPAVEEVAPVTEEVSAVEEVAPVTEEVPAVEEVTPVAQKKISQENTDALNNPPEEIFEDVNPLQPENLNNLQMVARGLKLPLNATLAEVRGEFEKNKNDLPPAWTLLFEKTLGKI